MICEVEWDHPDAVALREARRADIAEAYGRDGTEPTGSEETATDMAVFLVAYREGAPVACGGLRPLDEHAAEIKGMYAVPGVRGTGVATKVLRSLEWWTIAHDVAVLRLETGDALRAAQRFYEREGYIPVPPFGPYVGAGLSRCYERRLSGDGVLVPALHGMAWDQARRALHGVGLVVAASSPAGSPTAVLGWPDEVVIGQRPAAGSEMAIGSMVSLWLGRDR